MSDPQKLASAEAVATHLRQLAANIENDIAWGLDECAAVVEALQSDLYAALTDASIKRDNLAHAHRLLRDLLVARDSSNPAQLEAADAAAMAVLADSQHLGLIP